MRILRWAFLMLALAGGSFALGGRPAVAAPVPSAGLAAQGGLATPLAAPTQYGYRRRYYRPRYYYGRRYYRPRFYARRYYGPRFYRPRAYYGRPYSRRHYYRRFY